MADDVTGGMPGGHRGEAYQLWYAEKRKLDGRERTRRCRARKLASAANEQDPAVPPHNQRVSLTRQQYEGRVARISANLAKEFVDFASSRLESFDSNIQHLTIQKFLGHTAMKTMIPPFLSNLKTVKLQHSVVSSVRTGMRDHLVGSKPSKIVMAKDILCTFASSSDVGSGRGFAGLLGVDRRNFLKARGRRMVLDSGHDGFWLHDRRVIRSDSLSDHVKAVVAQWWTNETTVSPNMKDVVTFREGLRQWLSHPTHFLQCSQVLSTIRISIEIGFIGLGSSHALPLRFQITTS